MRISLPEIEPVASKTGLPFIEGEEWFKFDIRKKDHGFHVQVLHSGQYIFVSLIIDDQIFPIEHIEFYMGESSKEVIDELIENLNRLNLNETRFSEQSGWLGPKMKVEILEDDEWVGYGYPGKKISRKANT